MDSFQKAEKIISDYKTREYRQEDLAKKYGISIDDIKRLTKVYGFVHTKDVNAQNRNEGQIINPIITQKDLTFLDKYGDEHFENK